MNGDAIVAAERLDVSANRSPSTVVVSPGIAPGRRVHGGQELPFEPNEMGYANGVTNENDQLYMRVETGGDTLQMELDRQVP